MSLKVFVEGGGDWDRTRTACRKGFTELFRQIVPGRRPRVEACGGRHQAFKDFSNALERGEPAAILLVDAERAIAANDHPWDHLRVSDAWFLTDIPALEA